MIKKEIPYFDLEKISNSGQCFRLVRRGEERFALTAMGRYLEMEQRGTEVCFYCDRKEFQDIWETYFDLKADYERIEKCVDPDDAYLSRAVQCASGVRILRQEFWETVVSFIISQQNHIPRIRKCVETLCRSYGEQRVNLWGETYYTFPGPERLAKVSEEELRGCNLGYRAKYIRKSAEMVVAEVVDLREIADMEYRAAKAELMKLCGVGTKVAECICLFALHHIEAFPVDTHIQDMLRENYPNGFPFERYHGFAGVMQQYAFYYELWGEKEILQERRTS